MAYGSVRRNHWLDRVTYSGAGPDPYSVTVPGPYQTGSLSVWAFYSDEANLDEPDYCVSEIHVIEACDTEQTIPLHIGTEIGHYDRWWP